MGRLPRDPYWMRPEWGLSRLGCGLALLAALALLRFAFGDFPPPPGRG